MEETYFLGDILWFVFENLFIIFMLYMWMRTATRTELRDLEMRTDLRIKRIHDHERDVLERLAALEERTKK